MIKRYGAPLVVSLALYSLLYALAGTDIPYFSIGLLWAVVLSYLIRLCDDIGDYEADVQKGKAPIGKKPLIVLTCLAAAVMVITVVVTQRWWVLLPAALIPLTMAIPQKLQHFIKPLFVPAILLTLAGTCFQLNAGVYLLSALMLLGDGALIYIKEKRHDFDPSTIQH